MPPLHCGYARVGIQGEGARGARCVREDSIAPAMFDVFEAIARRIEPRFNVSAYCAGYAIGDRMRGM